MRGEALTMTLMCPYSSLEIGGEPCPNVSKVEGLICFIRDEGEALTMALICPHSPLGIGGESRPNTSRVEDLVHFRRDAKRGPNNDPYVPSWPIRNRRRTSS